ncbi:hypothetical protein KNSL1_013754, partial [Colletotrichum chrysophilum]
MTPYVYTPFPEVGSDNRFIRVLDLLPNLCKEKPLAACLRAVRLEDQPEYECLSYRWGAAIKQYKLRIFEGTDDLGFLNIGESLHHALVALRRPSGPRTIWADAVCINQEDCAERSSQVAYMGPIYWSSSSLAIWLGNDPRGHAKLAFDALKPISAGHWNNDRRFNLTRKDVDNFDTTAWNAVAELYANRWFQRAWVQQEIGLSRKSFFYWGDAGPISLHEVFGFDIWMDLNDAGDRIKELFIKDATTVKNTRNLWLDYGQATHPNWLQGEDFKQHVRKTPFLVVLKNGMHCQASDPRDHIYAFLGHPSSRKRQAYGDVENERYMSNYSE